MSHSLKTWRTFRIFFIFSARGGGVEAPEGSGGSVFIEKAQEGGSPGREGPRGRRVSAANWEIFLGGGVAKYFFGGPKCPPRKSIAQYSFLRCML